VLLLSVKRLSVTDCLAYVMIGYMANAVLPFRLGEVARPVLLGEIKQISKSAVLATIVLERLFDVLSLILLAIILAFVMDIPPKVRGGIFVVGSVAVAGFAILWVTSLRQKTDWIARMIPSFIPDFVQRKGLALAESFIIGLKIFHRNREFLVVLIYSILSWGIVCVGATFYLKAFGFSLPWFAPPFEVMVINLGTMVPSSPGYVGVVHLLDVVALSVFGVGKSAALGFAIVRHGVVYILTVSLGIFFLWREGIAWEKVGTIETEASRHGAILEGQSQPKEGIPVIKSDSLPD